MHIIFGTKKLTESARTVSVEKYEGRAVVTVEGQKGAKKSRRVLFNNTASTLLGLEPGSVQQVVFAPVQDTRQVLIANLDSIDEDARGEMVTYRTSKNKVSYGEETSEKGKSLTTSFMCKELFSFFGEDDSQDLEFDLNEFPSEDLEAFSLDLIRLEDGLSDDAEEVALDSCEQPDPSIEIPSVDSMVVSFTEALEAKEEPEESLAVERIQVESYDSENLQEDSKPVESIIMERRTLV